MKLLAIRSRQRQPFSIDEDNYVLPMEHRMQFFDTPARPLHDSGEASSIDVRSSRAITALGRKVSRLPNGKWGVRSRCAGRGSIGISAVILQGKPLNNTGSKPSAQRFISAVNRATLPVTKSVCASMIAPDNPASLVAVK